MADTLMIILWMPGNGEMDALVATTFLMSYKTNWNNSERAKITPSRKMACDGWRVWNEDIKVDK